MRTNASLWEKYEAAVVPANAGEVQRKETRRAFYAGAGGILASLVNDLDADTEPTEADIARLDALANELERFRLDVREGRA